MINLDDIKPIRGTEEAGDDMPEVRRIVIHCSATPPGGWVSNARRIHNMHVEENGWSACGYHYVLPLDGTVEGGRPTNRTGAGVRGYNHDSIHICLIGGLNEDGEPSAAEYTRRQWDSLRELCLALLDAYPDSEIMGHYALDPLKVCPCFPVKDWAEEERLPGVVEPEPEAEPEPTLPNHLTINGVTYTRS